MARFNYLKNIKSNRCGLQVLNVILISQNLNIAGKKENGLSHYIRKLTNLAIFTLFCQPNPSSTN